MPTTTSAPIRLVYEGDMHPSVAEIVQFVGDQVRLFGYKHLPGTYKFMLAIDYYLSMDELKDVERRLNDPDNGIHKHLDATLNLIVTEQRDGGATGFDLVMTITTTRQPIFPV